MRGVLLGALAATLSVCVVTGQTDPQPQPTLAVVREDTPLRLFPDTKRQALTTIPAGVTVKVVKVEGDWANVIYRDPAVGDRRGYISAAAILGNRRPQDVKAVGLGDRTGAANPPSDRAAKPPSRSEDESRSASTRPGTPLPHAPAVPNPSSNLTTVNVTLTLVDADLNVKPVPRHALLFGPSSGAPAARVVTGFDGKAETRLAPGSYRVTSERPLDFQGKAYSWSKDVSVKGDAVTLDLSTDDTVTSARTDGGAGNSGGLPALFREWQNSVVTVWSETGHGSGFLIDPQGLILTNQHVVGVSNYAAVQFSEALKVPATIVARSPEQDLAVLRVNSKHVSGITPVRLGYAENGSVPAVEGQQVFTIGSPLNQRKAMTSGIVSKIEPHAIISDVNINHGNSGGPLFTTDGLVLGVTTFGDFTSAGGPGISGIVRIDEARGLIEQARKNFSGAPSAEETLPVEASTAYPLGALKEIVTSRQIKPEDYHFSASDFEVTLITPILTYGVDYAVKNAALQERAKRNKKSTAITGTVDPFQEYKNWAEYVGEFKPVLLIDARPKLVEGFWSAFGRGLAESQGHYGGPANLHFKSDFYRMRLYCGDREVIPIHPGKVEHRAQANNAAVRVNDITYEGLYTYVPDAIGPHCGTVRVMLFDEKDPQKADIRSVDPKLVSRIWNDFDAYRRVSAARD